MRVFAMLPIIASGKFHIEIDEKDWNSMSDDEKQIYFLDNYMASESKLCFQCHKFLDTNFDIDYTSLDLDPSDIKFFIKREI